MSDLLRVLSDETGLSNVDLLTIIRTAPRRYKVYEIPKRSGGMREIAQPSRELKMLQRVLIAKYLVDLPVHSAAMAYRPSISIYDNAAAHAGSTPILKMDFKDFFPSIRSRDWESYCLKHGLLADGDREISSKLFFRRAKDERVQKLSIGAPSSPALSNILLFDFDTTIAAEAEKRGIAYTRYADDLTFSGQRAGMLRDMVKVVTRATREMRSPKLRVNEEKTVFVTTANRRTVTGLVLATDGAIGVGRERRRLISAKVHRALVGSLDVETLKELSGELAFINVADKPFIERLRAKYGNEIIKTIKSAGASSS